MSTTEKALTSELFETTIKFRVNNVSSMKKKFIGPSFTAQGKTFRPMLKVGENKEGRYSTLGIFLRCDWHGHVKAQHRTCNAEIQYSLHSQDAISKDMTRQTSCTFGPNIPDWGYSNYIAWSELIKPAWMANDSISVEIKLEVKEEIEVETAELQEESVDVGDVEPQNVAKNTQKGGTPKRRKNRHLELYKKVLEELAMMRKAFDSKMINSSDANSNHLLAVPDKTSSNNIESSLETVEVEKAATQIEVQLPVSVGDKLETTIVNSIATHKNMDGETGVESCDVGNIENFLPATEEEDRNSDSEFVLLSDN